MADDQETQARRERVTVVVCPRPEARDLEVALHSVACQTHRDLEVVVLGGAEDRSAKEVCDRIVDQRFGYRAYDPARGVAVAYYRAFEMANTPFLAMLGATQVWEATFLEKLVGALQAEPGACLAFCDRVMTGPGHGADIQTPLPYRPGIQSDPIQIVMQTRDLPAVGAVFRRAALDMLRFNGRLGEATSMWISYSLARSGRPLVYVPEGLVAAQAAEDATLPQGIEAIEAELTILDVQLNDGRSEAFRRQLATRKADLLRASADVRQSRGENDQARRDLIDSLWSRFSARTLFKLLTLRPQLR